MPPNPSKGGSGGGDDEPIEITCPVCGTLFHVPAKDAERSMNVRCPKGHDVPLVKML